MASILVLLLAAVVALDGNDWQTEESCLSLRATTSDTEGTAWFLKDVPGGGLDAYTGGYTLDDAGPAPGVQLRLLRRWRLQQDLFGVPRWHYDPSYAGSADQRYGVFAEYEQSAGGLTLSVIRSFALDAAGDAAGAIEPRSLHLKQGEVIKFPQTDELNLIDDLPPGMVKRSEWKNRSREKSRSVYRTDVLEKDLYGWARDQSYFVLSLQAGDSWDKGEARLFVHLHKAPNSQAFVYARGNYSVSLDKNHDALFIELPMTRVYRGRSAGGQLQWTASDSSGEATGLTLCIPLDDRGLRDDVVTTYVASTHFVNERGRKVRRYNDDGRLLRAATEKTVANALGVTLGTTYFLRPGAFFAGDAASLKEEQYFVDSLAASPPPGFQLRSRQETHVVARPVATADASTAAGRSELRKAAKKHYDEKRHAECIEVCSMLLAVNPGEGYAHMIRGHCYFEQQQYQRALEDYDALVKALPTAPSLTYRANANHKLGRYASAIDDYEQVLRLAPDDVYVLNAAAWIWATCPDATVRDGPRAVASAKKACELTGNYEAVYVDTLAAAYAEIGDFQMAATLQQDASKGMKGAEQPLARKRLDAYRRGQPHRDP
jgi:tetratricopeptide (TPR) repeat protein